MLTSDTVRRQSLRRISHGSHAFASVAPFHSIVVILQKKPELSNPSKRVLCAPFANLIVKILLLVAAIGKLNQQRFLVISQTTVVE